MDAASIEQVLRPAAYNSRKGFVAMSFILLVGELPPEQHRLPPAAASSSLKAAEAGRLNLLALVKHAAVFSVDWTISGSTLDVTKTPFREFLPGLNWQADYLWPLSVSKERHVLQRVHQVILAAFPRYPSTASKSYTHNQKY
jgi:hypothetical protein